MINDKERKKWLELSLSRNMNQSSLTLLYKFNSNPFVIAESNAEELSNIIGKKAFSIGKLTVPLARELTLMKKASTRLVFMEDSEYPPLLKEINNPPLFLRVKGKIPASAERMIAVVGTRRASSYGKRVCEVFTEEFTAHGFTVVSGLARGIDSKAHEAALKSGGKTIAVLGTGTDIVYPPENVNLAGEIIKNGALISEYPMGTKPLKQNFPIRNRIISGISCGIFVAEAPKKSGTMITASFAAEQGRDVWSACGGIFDKNYAGCHALIKDGAKLCESIEDIMGELSFAGFGDTEIKEVKKYERKILSKEEETLYSVIKWSPMSLDQIRYASGFDVSKIFKLLTNLQINGFIDNSPGGKFVRKK